MTNVLASDFAPATRDAWLAAVDRALKGADFDRSLVSTTLDGIRIEPLYTPDADERQGGVQAPLAPRPQGTWEIRTTVAHPDPKIANAQALEDLANGATGVEFVVQRPEDLPILLDGIVLEAAPVALRPVAGPIETAAAFLAIADQATGCLGLDPVGSGSNDLAQAIDIAREAAEKGVRTFRATGTTVADAGATEAQELAYVLAVATHYLRALTQAGVELPAAQIELELTADVDVFATIAKVRALRHAWATVVRESGIDDAAIHVSAVSSYRTLTVVDPWVNLLRGTAACLGAVAGGADSVTIAPFDSADSLPGDLGRRMARNTQLILQSESGIGQVLDPAGGSWYVEALTDELAAKAWAGFQRIEVEGLHAGLSNLRQEIADAAAARDLQVARRKRPITGVSEFPLLGETRPNATPAARQPAAILPRHRLAEPFEALRAAGEASGERVFLANLGPVAAHNARATFAANLFAVGGIASTAARVDAATAPEAFATSGARVACLCSSDELYADQAAAVATALRAAGAQRVYLAGKVQVPGVDETVAIGANVLDVLAELHSVLKIGENQ